MRDDTVLTTVRPVSNLSELYFQFAEYRLEILEERIRKELKTMRETKERSKKLNTRVLKSFLKEQESFLGHMNKEIIEDDQVKMGEIDDSHLLGNGDNERKLTKRARVE